MTPEHALQVADQLADPAASSRGRPPWWRQSLAHGAPGIALLHVELAAAGAGSWQPARAWLNLIAAGPITTGPAAGPLYGAPAVAHVLAGVQAARPGACRRSLERLDSRIAVDTRRRLCQAHARHEAGRMPVLSEFDAIRGLAGIGAYLLRRDPRSDLLHAVLAYLVRLTYPRTGHGHRLPGWWVPVAPTGRPDPVSYPGGHANAGMAHGIGGPLALLALAHRHGVRVTGIADAIEAICGWLEVWRIDTDHGCRWPYLLTLAEETTGHGSASHSGARRRPSWCYGTTGLARAQQLAALATGNTRLRERAERALAGALNDPAQRAATVDACLCHGFTGLAHIAARAAADAADPATLRGLADGLTAAASPADLDGDGLLEGRAGAALAGLAAAERQPPTTGWDRCLLIA